MNRTLTVKLSVKKFNLKPILEQNYCPLTSLWAGTKRFLKGRLRRAIGGGHLLEDAHLFQLIQYFSLFVILRPG